MVIGYISIASTSFSPVSFNDDILNEDIYSSDSYAAASNGVTTQASDVGFTLDIFDTSYVDPNTGVLYAVGYNSNGQLGNGTTTNVQSFTALYKSGDEDEKFLNPVDWSLEYTNSAVIDSEGMLWTAGWQNYGNLGNGVISSTVQTSFEQPVTGSTGLPSGYKAEAVDVGRYSTIVMLDDGSFYGAGEYQELGLSSTGGYTDAGASGGGNYKYFTKMTPTWASSRKVVDFKVGNSQSLWLLDDGTLWRANKNGWAQVSEDGVTVSSFDIIRYHSYYVTSIGDVYYAGSATSNYSKILSRGEYTGTIDSIYTSGSGGWAYLTTNGDVYYAPSAGGKTFYHIAEDVIYFDMGGYSYATFGAITTDKTFKLWGSDNNGQLGNGTGQTDNIPDTSEGGDPMAAFKSDVANVYNYKTADGGQVVLPPVDENGETEKNDDGNYVDPETGDEIVQHPYINNPAPANGFIKPLFQIN